MVPDIFGAGVLDADFERVLAAMPTDKPGSLDAREHMAGIMRQIQAGPRDQSRIDDLKIYLTEIDRRRGTNWHELFPWLADIT